MLQSAVLVERRMPRQRSLLHELKGLAEAAGYRVVGSLVQIRFPDAKFQIGAGKAEELAKLVREEKADKVIFENDLKPIQAFNLAKATGIEVIDRFQLILEVFSKHASTTEAKHQIELAALKYELMRVKEKVHLAKMEEQPGFHGLGRTDVEKYRLAIKRRIVHTEDQLKKIRLARGMKRGARSEIGLPVVSLAGYTASGKSTLFNTLTGGTERVTGSLFTTLSTKTSAVDFSGKKTLLIDTVGFIDGLPLTLIEAFRSTLEEMTYSQLVILVLDASDPFLEIQRKLTCSLETLRGLIPVSTPIITALNKMDLVGEEGETKILGEVERLSLDAVPISALKGMNIEALRGKVCGKLGGFIKASFILPAGSAALPLIAEAHNLASVLEESWDGETIQLTIKSMDYLVEKIRGHVEAVGGKIVEAVRV